MTQGNKAYEERIYRMLYLIRRTEEEVIRLYPTDKIKSPVHLSIGQEAVSAGVCDALRPNDIAFGTYRGHALYLAKGGDLDRMMAELYGKQDGCARGKAGSMHLVDAAAGMMGTSAVVATTLPLAVGYAMAMQMQGNPAVVVVFCGDGSLDEGVAHESLNFAALRKLPLLFVCENNFYAIYSKLADRMSIPDICARARVYGIPAERIDSGNVHDIRTAAARALDAIRAGEGPQFLECLTYRWRDHVGPDEDRVLQYRPDTELDEWMARDEVARVARTLADDTRTRIESEVEEALARAIAFAEASPYPPDEELYDHVFA